MTSRNEFSVESVSGGYIVECAFPFADYSKEQRRVIVKLDDVIKLMREYYAHEKDGS